MNRKRSRFVRRIVLALAVAALLAPAASAVDLRSPDTRDAALAASPTGADLRSPDTHDASIPTEPSPVGADFRSPDTRDAASAEEPIATLGDLRSPDTREAADGYRPAATSVIVHVPGPGFDWGDAGIGALGAFAVALLAAGAMLVVFRHRRSRVAAL